MTTDPRLIRAARVASSTWSDALDRLRLPGTMRGLSWQAGTQRVAGRAVTVREETGPLGQFPVTAFDVGRMLEAAGPGEILVIDMGGAEVSSFGGLAASAAVGRGIAGVVVDGGCRDIEDVRRTGLAVVSRHLTPISGKERARMAEFSRPVTCGGVTVAPVDVVIADQTGVVVVPAARFDEVLELAEQLERTDQRFQQALDAGQSFGTIAATLKHM